MFSLKPTAFAVSITMLAGAPVLAADPSLDLVAPLADYKIYVAENTAQLVADTDAFVEAIKSGDLETAKALYAPTRTSYEKVEPIAELFSDLDVTIDARADDYEHAEADPNFTGFHRIEYALWVEDDTAAAVPFAERLMADVTDLDARINALTFPPDVVVAGAATLMEEVAATKISGEEDRYSGTDLWDFEANFAGAKKIYALLRPLITDDAAFIEKTDGNFDEVDEVLAKYREGEGFKHYEALTDDDRAFLSSRVNTLAEDLSMLPGKLGLS
ncbi:iron uptake system protein EfeO [Falsirhodobacter sp. alg1]|uniref:iron uptake system protein EfeO n=1 Tax=Falsirhodobacter sp. alg1 TaxID=1472418 RepID=UPI0005F0B7CE|nr:iron uptake system protein EfeO [Falsirhodobacter sp. alg1]